jgi:hypothetical protein
MHEGSFVVLKKADAHTHTTQRKKASQGTRSHSHTLSRQKKGTGFLSPQGGKKKKRGKKEHDLKERQGKGEKKMAVARADHALHPRLFFVYVFVSFGGAKI